MGGARRRPCGFTLLELLVVLAIAAVLAAVAVPNLRPFIQSNRLTAASNDLLRSFQLARSEATRQQANVVVCASSAPAAASPACDGSSFTGWIVFVDTNSNWAHDSGELVLERHDTLDPSILVRNDNDAIESYSPTGFALPAGARTPTRNISLCILPNRVNNNPQARALAITKSGRALVSLNTIVACQ